MPVIGNHCALFVLILLNLTQFAGNNFNVLVRFLEKLVVDLIHLRLNVVAIPCMLLIVNIFFIRHDRWGHIENILLAGFQKQLLIVIRGGNRGGLCLYGLLNDLTVALVFKVFLLVFFHERFPKIGFVRLNDWPSIMTFLLLLTAFDGFKKVIV